MSAYRAAVLPKLEKHQEKSVAERLIDGFTLGLEVATNKQEAETKLMAALLNASLGYKDGVPAFSHELLMMPSLAGRNNTPCPVFARQFSVTDSFGWGAAKFWKLLKFLEFLKVSVYRIYLEPSDHMITYIPFATMT